MKTMKSGKVVGPDEMFRMDATGIFNQIVYKILESQRTPEEWRRSVLVPCRAEVTTKAEI